jgi:hypothetical protein
MVDLGFTPAGGGDGGDAGLRVCGRDAAVLGCEPPTGLSCADTAFVATSCTSLVLSGSTAGLTDDFEPASVDADCTDPVGRPDFIAALRVCDEGLYSVRPLDPQRGLRVWTLPISVCPIPANDFFCVGSAHANSTLIGVAAGQTIMILVENGDAGPFDIAVEWNDTLDAMMVEP